MKKYIIFIGLLIVITIHSQVKINYTIESHIETYQLKLKIDITNSTNNYYILPFDITGFKGFYDTEYCGVYNDKDYPYRFFAPTVMINKEGSQEYIYPASTRGHYDGADSGKIIKEIERNADKEIKDINVLKNKYHFKSYEMAFKNYYITKNLLILNPHEKYSYAIYLDLGAITRTDSSTLYDYYFLEFSKYNLSLHLCITDDAYDWLTIKQKKKLSKYKFFTGTIKSNSFLFEAYK